MMYLTVIAAFVVFGLSTAQHGNSGALHAICHSNHLQLTEDQVIQNVVDAMNTGTNDTIDRAEVLVFFADLMGIQLGAVGGLLENMTDEEILQVASGLKISEHDFVQAWHKRFHDSVEFVKATFQVFDVNGDSFMDGLEIEGIVNTALATGDANMDGLLEEAELVTFLERIYKNC